MQCEEKINFQEFLEMLLFLIIMLEGTEKEKVVEKWIFARNWIYYPSIQKELLLLGIT